jgi:hypothetical protein
MLCRFCQENVRGTPCQTASQASKCVNNRDDDWPDDRMECESDCQKQNNQDKKSERTE